jgi:phosphatidylglycerol:prolipoprotein diacylglycerol transferase
MANFINGELYGRVTHVAWAMQFPKELVENDALSQRAVAAASDPRLTDPDSIIVAARHNSQITDALRAILPPRHPSQLYEAFCEGVLLFSILWFVRTRFRTANGVLIGLFFICYAIFRIVIENFREPDAPLVGAFTRGQFLSFFLIALGAGFIASAKLRPAFPRRQVVSS